MERQVVSGCNHMCGTSETSSFGEWAAPGGGTQGLSVPVRTMPPEQTAKLEHRGGAARRGIASP